MASTLTSTLSYLVCMSLTAFLAFQNRPPSPLGFSALSPKPLISLTSLTSISPTSPVSLVRTVASALSLKSAIFFCASDP